MAIEIRPINKTLGAEIVVDLGKDLDEATFEAVRKTWLDRKVVLFRNQKLEEEDLIRFSRRLGENEIHVRANFHSKFNPEVMIISNAEEKGKPIGVLGDAEAPWHIDQIYQQKPTFGTLVYCVQKPPEGGNTFFCDLATAYERLPAALRAKIDGKRGINSVEYFNRRNNLQMTEEQLRKAPDVSHPLVRTHPVLGRKSLFFSPGHTARIEGYSEEASQDILEELERYATAPDLVWEHTWSIGDAVMWDNSATMHRRDPFDGAHIRLLKRVSFMYPPDLRTPF